MRYVDDRVDHALDDVVDVTTLSIRKRYQELTGITAEG